MSRALKLLVSLASVPLLLALLAYYVWPTGQGISDRLTERARAELQGAGFTWTEVSLDPVDGGARHRVARLSGSPPTQDGFAQARTALLSSLGGYGLSDGIHDVLIPDQAPAEGISPYVWKLDQKVGSFELTGYVPSEAVRQQIVAYATTKLAPATVVDKMVVGAGAPGGDWLGTVKRGIDHVASLGNQSAEMIDSELTVVGRTTNVGLRERILTEMADTLPQGFRGRAVIEIAEPVAAPPEPVAAPPADTPAADPVVDQCQQRIDALTRNQVIEFESGQATLRVDPNPLLDQLADVVKSCAGTRVQIAGHTDTVGSSAFNQRLSDARAQTVQAYLIRKGIDESRLTAVGFGENRPVMQGDSEEAHKRNRRIEFSVSRAEPRP